MAARLYQRYRNAMQSGKARTGEWVLQFESRAAKRPDPLTGWSGGADTQEQVDVAHVSVAVLNTMQNFFHPSGSFTAGTALSTAFVVIEPGECPQVSHDARGFIHDNEATGTQHGARLKSAIGERLIAHQAWLSLRCFQDKVGRQYGHRRSSGNDGFHFPSLPDAAAIFF